MTEEQVTRIIQNWSTSKDTWDPSDLTWNGLASDATEVWAYPPPREFFNVKSGYKFRELPEHFGERARDYIAACTRKYPVQLRLLLGFPMWLRFCDTWNDTGRFHTAMRAI